VPLVTVLMPVYNGAEFLEEAIDSILLQTFQDFELLIINDGSTDNSEHIILGYNDSRIRYEKNEQNLRLIATLNKGLDMATGKYIVRMDADDISLPQRIERQVGFMESNIEIAVAGSWIETFAPDTRVVQFVTDPDILQIKNMFSTCLNHPSVILRRSFMVANKLYYPCSYVHAEDYALWCEIIKANGRIGMVGDVLLKYRVHTSNIGVKHHDEQLLAVLRIRKENLSHLLDVVDEYSFSLFNHFVSVVNIEFYKTDSKELFKSAKDYIVLSDFINALFMANREKRIYNIEKFELYLGRRFFNFSIDKSSLGIGVYNALKNHDFFRFANSSYIRKTWFFYKFLMRLKA